MPTTELGEMKKVELRIPDPIYLGLLELADLYGEPVASVAADYVKRGVIRDQAEKQTGRYEFLEKLRDLRGDQEE